MTVLILSFLAVVFLVVAKSQFQQLSLCNAVDPLISEDIGASYAENTDMQKQLGNLCV